MGTVILLGVIGVIVLLVLFLLIVGVVILILNQNKWFGDAPIGQSSSQTLDLDIILASIPSFSAIGAELFAFFF